MVNLRMNQGIELLEEKKYEEAILYFCNLYKEYSSLLGKVDERTNHCLYYLAKSYYYMQDYHKAREYGEECIKRAKSINGLMIYYITLMVDTYEKLGEEEYKDSLTFENVRLFSPYQKDNSKLIFEQGVSLLEIKKYEEAYAYFKEIYITLKGHLGPLHALTIDGLYYITYTLYQLGNYQKAYQYGEECCRRNKTVKRTHMDSLDLMFRIYIATEDYTKALELAQFCFEEIEKVFQEGELPYFRCLHYLALSNYYMGNLEVALELFNRCKDIVDQYTTIPFDEGMMMKSNMACCLGDLGKNDEAIVILDDVYSYFASSKSNQEETLNILDNFSAAYLKLGLAKGAIELLERSYSTRIKLGKANSLDTLTCMNNLASAYSMDHQTQRALALLEECKEKRIQYYPEYEIDLLATINNLAVNYEKNQDYATSLSLNKECYQRRCELLGKSHIDTLISLYNLAKSYLLSGEVDLALEKAKECLEERRKVLGNENIEVVNTLGLLARITEKKDPLLQYQYLKEYLLDYIFFVVNTNHQELIQYFADFNENYGKYRNLFFKQKTTSSLEKDLLIRNKDIIFDVELIQSNSDIKNKLTQERSILAAINQQLSTHPKGEGKLIKKKNECIQRIHDLINNEAFMKLIHSTSIEAIQKELEEEDLVLDIYELEDHQYGIIYITNQECFVYSIENIEEYLCDGLDTSKYSRLYFALDGKLANLSIERLIKDKMIIYLSSIKSLIGRNHIGNNDCYEVFVNANFNAKSTTMSRDQFGNLASGKVEEGILTSLMDNYHIHTGENFNKKELLGIKHPHILHISTHGSYEESCEDLMERSRIILSGYNLEENKRNTYLSAKEAYQLDLEGTHLVFLSTCVSGKGQIVDGEGMYGFRRSLEMAGCKYIITTIEGVDDINATIFAHVFYRNYLACNEVEKAFYKTKAYLRTEEALQEIEDFICIARQYDIEYSYLELRINKSRAKKRIMKGQYSRKIEDWNGFILQKA